MKLNLRNFAIEWFVKQRKGAHNPDNYISNLLKEGMHEISQKIVEKVRDYLLKVLQIKIESNQFITFLI